MSQLTTKIRSKLSPSVICGIILCLIFSVALAIRVCLPYDSVFGQGWVKFAENDPWYHLRIVENLVHHFPFRISFDPYTLYPSGQSIPFAPFFDLLLGFFVWVIGLGSPTQHTIEVVTAYFPAILGALVTIPVFFIGKELFNWKAGLFAAALIAILPGEFLSRSLLGSTDHHVAEVLFSTVAILFLILAIKRARESEVSFNSIRNRQWANLRKPLIYALLTGIALGVYLTSWIGGLLFLLIVFTFTVLLFLIEHLRGKSTDYLCIIMAPVFLIALIIVVPFRNQLLFSNLYVASLAVGLLAILVLSIVSHLMEGRNIKRVYYPLVLAGLGSVGLVCFRFIDPSLFNTLLGKFSIFTPDTGALTIGEARPLLSTYGTIWSRFTSTCDAAWGEFTTGIIMAPVAFILITYTVIKKVSAEKILLLVWSVMMLAATLGQVRFAYYLAVNVALLSGYLCWKIPGWISGIISRLGFRDRPAPQVADSRWRKEKRKQKKSQKRRAKVEKKQPEGLIIRPWFVSAVLAIIVVFFLAFYPNFFSGFFQEGRTITTAKYAIAQSGPDEDWHEALLWMGNTTNTPDPFPDDPNKYYELYDRPAAGVAYDYNKSSAYGVMSWWDYGHWITEIAHRIPNANPFQAGATEAGQFFTAQDESSANAILDGLGSRYVIIDYAMAIPYLRNGMVWGKFYAMPLWAHSELEFYEVYYQYEEGGWVPRLLFYPAYYQSMCSRLYNFGGEKVVPDNTTYIVSYKVYNGYKFISSLDPYTTYDAAEADLNLKSQNTDYSYAIVGTSQFNSPVPLASILPQDQGHYTPIYSSPTSEVKIFKYDP